MDVRGFRRLEPARKIILAESVHQKSDRAEIHPINRHPASEKPMQRLQHEAVAAERHDDVRVLLARVAVARAQVRQYGLGLRVIASSMAASTSALSGDARSGARKSAASSCPRHI